MCWWQACCAWNVRSWKKMAAVISISASRKLVSMATVANIIFIRFYFMSFSY
jgi:hypothetical protein